MILRKSLILKKYFMKRKPLEMSYNIYKNIALNHWKPLEISDNIYDNVSLKHWKPLDISDNIILIYILILLCTQIY